MFHIDPTGVYTSPELAKLFQIGERYIWPLLLSGQLRGRKVGKRWFVTGADVLAFISGMESAGDQQEKSTDTESSPDSTVSGTSTEVAGERLANSMSQQPLGASGWENAEQAGDQQVNGSKASGIAPEAVPASDTRPAGFQQVKSTQRAARWAALSQAWAEADGDPRQAAALLNERMAAGGPGPERGALWTHTGVRQSAKRIRKTGIEFMQRVANIPTG